MANPFIYENAPNQSGLVIDMVEVTTNDSTDNVGSGNIAIGLYVETGGDVVFLNKDGNERTVTVPDFHTLTCSVKRVKSTGTTATGIHALVV
jgi:hypothetical protein